MADEDGMSETEIDSGSTSRRWTCEACGCHTNTEESDTVSCGVCGTRRSPSLLRRGTARILGRGFHHDDDDDDDAQDDDDEADNENIDHHRRISNDNTDATRLFMAGVTDSTIPFRGGNTGSSRRLLRTGSGSNSFNPLLRHNAPGRGSGRARRSDRHGNIGPSSNFSLFEPEELLLFASENSSSFNPKWSVSHKGPDISVDEENHPHVAYLGENGDEGRCIRAVEPIPTTLVDGMNGSEEPQNIDRNRNNEGANSSTLNRRDRKKRNIFGWKVVFEHCSRDVGKSMGGCYLVGVTTGGFSSFSERNGLQQSQQFWGIEDGGRKYEGNNNRSRPSGASSSNGVQLSRNEAARNSDNVLFGSREVITIVADIDARTLTYWRDARLLGTLVTGLPRGSVLYPVAVPFNVGVWVSITGLDGDPLSILSDFHAAQRLALEAKNETRRKALAEQKDSLITNGSLSVELVAVLRNIFSWYASKDDVSITFSGTQEDHSKIKLNALSAARLWYRCGFRFSHLRLILETSPRTFCSNKLEKADSFSNDESWRSRLLSSDDFIAVISRIVEEETNVTKEDDLPTNDSSALASSSTGMTDVSSVQSEIPPDEVDHNPPFEVGDRVEVAEAYERYGDAASGPLRPGNRGTVMEVQRGPRGDRQSVRVVFNGRRWWYQPPALISERSGLLQSPAIRVIHNILRAHGYDSSLQPLWGKQVTTKSWEHGDLVLPSSPSLRNTLLKTCKKLETEQTCSNLIGRIVTENSSSLRESGFVTVDFAGLKGSTKRVDIQSLIHTTFYHYPESNSLSEICSDDAAMKGIKVQDFHSHDSDDDQNTQPEDDGQESSQTSLVRTNLSKHIAGVAKLDKESIAYVLKECRSSASLAGMFCAGLSNAILSAMNCALRGEHDSSSIKSLGSLIVTVTRQLFNESLVEEYSTEVATITSSMKNERTKMATEENAEGNNSLESSIGPSSNFRSNSNSVNVRDLIRDLGVGPDQRRGVLLALMASARMNEATRNNPDTSSTDDLHTQRGRHFLSSFSRLSAEAAAFGYSSLQQNVSEDENSSGLNAVSSDTPSFQSGSFLQSILRGGSECSPSSQKNSTSRRSLNAATRSLIYDGILLNNHFWVKKALKLGANVDSSRDEDENTLLLVAISFGCSDSILKALIKAGAAIKEREIQEAAWSNQPLALSLLLQHAIYTEGSIDKSCCSQEILDTFLRASERQKLQENAMHDIAEDFSVELLKKTVSLALRFRIEKKRPHFELLADALVGNVLLHTMHISQIQGKFPKSGESGSNASDDGRIPAFSTFGSSSIFPNPSSSVPGPGSTVKGNNTFPGHQVPFSSLLDHLPPSVFGATFISNDTSEIPPALTSYLRLTEMYLWSKDMRDASIGLTLAHTLLKKTPTLCDNMRRYGIKDLALLHIEFADDSLSELDLINSTNNAFLHELKKNDSQIDPSLDSKNTFVVKCPKQHTTVLHLTRHSQFKCDLCGKGVEQSKPMYGCRECDWDACEECTDKAEGGLVKWTYIRNLAMECQLMLYNKNSNEFPIEIEQNLERICESIRSRMVSGVKDLSAMLNIPGKITLHEFSSHILPSLHQSFLYESNSSSLINSGVENNCFYPRRRSKKQRVACLSPNDHNQSSHSSAPPTTISKSTLIAGNDEIVGNGSSFVNIAIRSLLSPSIKGSAENEKRGNGSETNSMEVVETEAGQINEKHKDDLTEFDENSNDDNKGEEINASQSTTPFIPPILHYLHAVLAFHERMVVTRYTRRSNSDHSSQGGDLQSLLQPFEIKLKKSGLSSTRSLQQQNKFDSESFSDLNEASVHVEPLMPISELQRHILRCIKINIPSYLRYCHKLVLDRAIIVEHSTKMNLNSAQEDKQRKSRRIARVLEFDEETGAHRICYASHFISSDDNANSIDEKEEFFYAHNISTLDALEFNGKEMSVILAAKDYRILHREQNDDNGTFTVELDHGESAEILSNNMDVDFCSLNDSQCIKEQTYLSAGMRVESDINSRGSGKFEAFTILSTYTEKSIGNMNDKNNLSPRYNLVSDMGEVVMGVDYSKLRRHDINLKHQGNSLERQSAEASSTLRTGHHSIFERAVPVANSRRSLSSSTQSSDDSGSGNGRLRSSSAPAVGVLRRTWSALSPLRNMKPLILDSTIDVDENEETNSIDRSLRKRTRKLSIGGCDVEINVDLNLLEKPPLLNVELSTHESIPAIPIQNANETTLFSGIQRLLQQDKQSKRDKKFATDRKYTVYYSVFMSEDEVKSINTNDISCAWPQESPLPTKFLPPWARHKLEGDQKDLPNMRFSSLFNTSFINRSNLHSEYSPSSIGESEFEGNLGILSNYGNSEILDSAGKCNAYNSWISSNKCEGLNETCVQCLELIGVLSEKEVNGDINSSETNSDEDDNFSSMFVSEALTSKLLDQLEDPLTVVAGALPDWCRIAPCLAPKVFSHTSRRRLMECAAFGVSRSALKQQEAKIAVGPLRQKMAALRGRAVELVGEAFSGGAADPTALQLQADELYGMEDALANRINAAFRAQRWDERSLQCAKAVVRREFLLKDAAGVMGNYAGDSRVNRRRLEVRFDGESGFDAASGDEAGVTRGFYADVADALLSCEHVEGVCSSSPKCLDRVISDVESSLGSFCHSKLPLWIPDVDASGKVIIPTPRADPRSGVGVYPRPLSINDPMRGPLLECFRFMGRLFAAALRDGFVFPLPLSASFFKLVQSGHTRNIDIGTSIDNAMKSNLRGPDQFNSNSTSSSVSYDYPSNNSYLSSAPSSPNRQTNMSIDDIQSGEVENSQSSLNYFTPGGTGTNQDYIASDRSFKGLRHLSSLDLPRPGFLGGEIYAVENYICAALDVLDGMEPSLSEEELAQRRKRIAGDKSFARKALGKSYDCSFEEYFMDKTFVDPLDPSQGKDAAPLCRDGASIPVTIDNVREWVYLSKRFFLYDGVISQALAFRQGVNDFFSVNVLRLFTAEELYRDVCGGGDDVDKWDEDAIRSLFKLDGGEGAAEALVAVVAMGGEGGAALSRRFGPSSPTIGYLVKALLEANTTERRQFLSFVTSVPIVTPGQIEVVPIVNPAGEFLPMMDPGCLPRSNTCARRLYLPKFETFEIFSQVFWSVVREECRFKGFFEWRG